MENNCRLQRVQASDKGIDPNYISVYTKQKGYGREAVYVSFNEFYYGEIENLYVGDVFPNIDEHFDNYDKFNEKIKTHEEIVASNYKDEICEYFAEINEEGNEQ